MIRICHICWVFCLLLTTGTITVQEYIFQPVQSPRGQSWGLVTGIAQDAEDKGTRLGLSLAYDIVTKGHGGELKEKTKEGEGTEFTIML